MTPPEAGLDPAPGKGESTALGVCAGLEEGDSSSSTIKSGSGSAFQGVLAKLHSPFRKPAPLWFERIEFAPGAD